MRLPMGANLREGFALSILTLFSMICAGVIVYDEIIGKTVDNTILTILAFIIGVLSHQLGTQQGSTQASSAIRDAVNGSFTRNNQQANPATTITPK